MPWNWELPDWPNFSVDFSQIVKLEKAFLLKIGSAGAFLKTLGKNEKGRFIAFILSLEGLESSKIEGEFLDRESLQSSILCHFGLDIDSKKKEGKEKDLAKVLVNVYETFDLPLTDEMLHHWHAILFEKESYVEDKGKYRTQMEAMQIVSNRYGDQKVFFEAPPASKVSYEMERFINWFNQTRNTQSILGRAAIAHLYFENIHPFEDGNGRIGRLLIEKVLSQGVSQPVLIAVSKVLEKRKKEYYLELQRCNTTLNVQGWVEFFSEVILQAQKESVDLLYFLIEKSKMFVNLSGKINKRQEKALLRMFEEGPSGFKGGLSAENYIAITKTSKATATRDLSDLVKKGALIKKGELRHTRYFLNLIRSLEEI